MTLARSRHDYDEDDVRVRPGRRGSRPRTRRRPAHESAAAGFVTAVDRGRYRCLVDGHQVTAMRARELGRKGVVVGDRVALVGDISGEPDALARIVRVEPRRSALRRTADDTDPFERIVVANADRLVIVTALADPEPRPRMIDRCLVAAHDAGMAPLLCLTKADLAAPGDLLAVYAPLEVPSTVTRRGEDPAELRKLLAGQVSVLVGHSGVGKSTLVNALVPEASRAVSQVNAVTGRGRHTSSSAIALELPDGGWIIDTPGVRSFGLAHVPPDGLVAAFPELAEGAVHCPPNCDHLQPDCALDNWVAQGHASPGRLDSLRRLLAGRDEDPAG
ncbi:ribosome small subunit-dependent GTPase A [Actinomadura craniellae]|uniref:Small ribosomal subunit biogenesis GTPase RsgA n=1 Tax=Actinomadura craniellae TaxID=2231787 RepID=A0A365H2T0_9ACTN|nr:ribosome small subunit-dependent GTPase A [Actinomadura craniellae]RAY13410.1 ribosome small subunit-dependent GTPase A [Actinomadura craniellae]